MKLSAVFSALVAGSSLVALASAAQAAEADGIGESENAIIVTTQRYEQRVQDVPVTLSALSGERMEEIGVSELDELSAYVPGLNIQEQSANNPGIVIRGITSDSGSAQDAARVTLYYNGVDISRSRGAYQGIYDMERIEVVKGPQATLFGTASTVGAISMVSAKPKPGLSAEVSGGYGNYDYYEAGGFLNAGNNVIAGRVAFKYKNRDGYVKNLAPNQDDLYGINTLGVRGSLRFTPTPDITADLVFTYDRQRNSGTPFLSRTLGSTAVDDVYGDAYLGGSPNSQEVLGKDKLGLDRDVYDVNFTFNWDFADGWSFTTVNGYRNFDSLEVFDADGSAASYLEFAEQADGWQFSHEGRFAYADDQWRAHFGWNYMIEDTRQYVPFSSEVGTYLQCTANIIPGLGCVAPDNSVPAALATGLATGGLIESAPYASWFQNEGRNQSWSMFGEATWIPTPALELNAGARVLIEKRRSGYSTYQPVAPIYGEPLLPYANTDGEVVYADRSYAAFLPRFNALLRVTDAINLYATISKGRRSPSVQVTTLTDADTGARYAGPNEVGNETVWNYEGGVKMASGIFSGSLGVYYQQYSDFQVTVIEAGGNARTISAGSASNLGVEAEVEVSPTSWLRAYANGGWIDGGIDNDPENGNLAGSRFRLQPEWQASAGLIIDAPVTETVSLFLSPSVTYRSKIYFETPNTEAISQPGVTLANVRGGVTFANGQYEIAGWARNLFDEKYLLDAGNTGGAFGHPTFIPAEPRTYGVTVKARF